MTTREQIIAHLGDRHGFGNVGPGFASWSEEEVSKLHRLDHDDPSRTDQIDHGAQIETGNPPKVRTVRMPRSGRTVTFEVQHGNPPKTGRAYSLKGNRFLGVRVH